MKHLILILFLFIPLTLPAQDTSRTDSAATHPDMRPAPQQSPMGNAQQSREDASPNWVAIATFAVALLALFFEMYRHLNKKHERELERIRQEEKKLHEQELERIRLEERERHEKEIEAYKIELEKKLAAAQAEGLKNFDQSQNAKKVRTAEQVLKDALIEELGAITLLGSPHVQSVPVSLMGAFVNLRLSETWRSEDPYQSPHRETAEAQAAQDLAPDEIIKRAFARKRLLLIIGDPGSGKTTLLKYYAMACLEGNASRLGLPEDVFVLYFPLRDLDVGKSLSANLTLWTNCHECTTDEQVFEDWLREKKTLILLDGLDEISSVEARKKACTWIDQKAAGLPSARFIVTSRWTGYAKLDGIELVFAHVRADIREFSWDQQQEFLGKWFRAVAQQEIPPPDAPADWREKNIRAGERKAGELIDYLAKKENQAVRKLADSPLLLQIIALLGRERTFHAHNRTELFSAAMNYLLDYRDRQRGLNPLLPADQATAALAPASLWMQEKIGRDDVSRQEMHDKLQPLITPMKEDLTAKAFCDNLCKRAGILAPWGDANYIFRHKSFREYLASLQMKKQAGEDDYLNQLAAHFGNAWWEEPLRFFMGTPDADLFDRFMAALFASAVTDDLTQAQQTLLELLISDAPAKKTDALWQRLSATGISADKKRYILNCLKTIGTKEARHLIAQYGKRRDTAARHARDMAAEFERPAPISAPAAATLFETKPTSFRNPLEENAEYILIPGGTYTFTVTKKKVTVPDTYFAKHPVTNKRYNRFIAYLRGEAEDLNGLLLLNSFIEQLLEFSKIEEGYKKYLGEDPKQWPKKLASKEDNKKFLGSDQPVTSVTWYDAMAYCLWLTLLGTASGKSKNSVTLAEATLHYRLPHEREWEWAAFGQPDGSLREFPWPSDKGEPTPKLANYGQNVGATTPVDRYPDGSTPQGLMNMAGNVWEWQSNNHDMYPAARSLRGGSWDSDDTHLRRPSRVCDDPDGGWSFVGFRVVFSESKVFDTLEI
ncbi:MAG: SUMF1/EgtB/PvdO family nonheme iron enzyme [Candidatus Zhuqueibacterota bacterium]